MPFRLFMFYNVYGHIISLLGQICYLNYNMSFLRSYKNTLDMRSLLSIASSYSIDMMQTVCLKCSFLRGMYKISERQNKTFLKNLLPHILALIFIAYSEPLMYDKTQRVKCANITEPFDTYRIVMQIYILSDKMNYGNIIFFQ